MNRRFLLAAFLVAVLSNHGAAGSAHAQNLDCARCHYDEAYTTGFASSVHGRNSCTSCHGIITDVAVHMTGREKPAPVDCGSCHAVIAREFRRNFHYLQEDFRCVDCHTDIHTRRASDVPLKIRSVQKCTLCHSNDEYVASGHAEAVLKGNMDAAACMDCHGLHDTRVYHTALETYPEEARMFYNTRCIACHSNETMMRRNNLTPKTVEYYKETYHGKVESVGFPTLVAGCADCHTTHNILPKTDPRSSIHPANLVKNCGRCHRGFHPRFVLYKAHPDYRDRHNYPVLYWTFVFMSGLLIATFAFFWVHTGLWWRKSYWEKHKREKEGLRDETCAVTHEGHVHVQRFSPWDRVMHLVLVLTFFTLVTTGFPLKYHTEPWAGFLIGLWGGAHNAGIFHRIAAAVLMGLFAVVVWRSVCFVFPLGVGKQGWKERLLGPDSLFPRWKDWEDLKGMTMWFFDRGERPRFDRWTYWEKFDFWAVFWGMFAIGGSGLLLWSPELSSYLVPGWVLNVAAIVHSEEALLAALFIFTVHFFNTHFVPDKFPMDRLIFTGTYSLDELRRFRPEEYERLVSTGKVEEIKRPHPSIFLKLAAATFGLASLLLGSFLTVLFILALVGW